MVYEAQEVIGNINDNLAWFLSFGVVGMLCNWWLLAESVRLGFRDKTYSIALFATYFWTAHDLAFMLLWHTWFVELDFFVWKLFWFNISMSLVFEVVFYYQMIKFGLNELFPGFSKRSALVVLFAGQVIAFVVFWYVKMVMGGDIMFLSMMVLTMFACPVFAIPIAMRRGSRRGQSIRLNVIYIIMVCGIWPAWYITHPLFQSPQFIGLGLVTIIWCIANVYVLKRMPPYVADNGRGAIAQDLAVPQSS